MCRRTKTLRLLLLLLKLRCFCGGISRAPLLGMRVCVFVWLEVLLLLFEFFHFLFHFCSLPFSLSRHPSLFLSPSLSSPRFLLFIFTVHFFRPSQSIRALFLVSRTLVQFPRHGQTSKVANVQTFVHINACRTLAKTFRTLIMALDGAGRGGVPLLLATSELSLFHEGIDDDNISVFGIYEFRTHCDDDNFYISFSCSSLCIACRLLAVITHIHANSYICTREKMLLNNTFGHDMHVCTQYSPESLNKTRRMRLPLDWRSDDSHL